MVSIRKQFSLESGSLDLRDFRESMRLLLAEAGFDEKKSGEVVLAVDERLTNIIRHGYARGPGRIEVSVVSDDHCLKVSVQDYCAKFNPLKQPKPKLPPENPGGLGIFLTCELMDEVVYDEACANGNLLHMTKYKKTDSKK